MVVTKARNRHSVRKIFLFNGSKFKKVSFSFFTLKFFVDFIGIINRVLFGHLLHFAFDIGKLFGKHFDFKLFEKYQSVNDSQVVCCAVLSFLSKIFIFDFNLVPISGGHLCE